MARSGTNIHVVPRGNGWAIKQEKVSVDLGHFHRQAEAAKLARSFVLVNGGGEVVIHRPNGEIRDKNTIGKSDPFPPRG